MEGFVWFGMFLLFFAFVLLRIDFRIESVEVLKSQEYR